MNRVLVTTSIKETYPQHGEIIFLGEWCKPPALRQSWENRNYKVMPYHWDDRRKLSADNEFIKKLYEELLTELSASLNIIHNTNYSIRYWRIIIGSWLKDFIQFVFNQWEMIKNVKESYAVSLTYIIDIKPEEMIAFNFNDFLSLVYNSDNWSHFVYSKIISEYTNIPIKKINLITDVSTKDDSTKDDNTKKLAPYIKNTIVNILVKILNGPIFNFVKKRSNYFIISPYISLQQEILLNLSLNSLPRFKFPEPIFEKKPINWELRSKLIRKKNSSIEFVKFIRDFIGEQLPTIYLENFLEADFSISKFALPQFPISIFTSSLHEGNDFFKIWAAGKVEAGTKLIIGQHGGAYGSVAFSSKEDHELNICDKYISWGWGSSNKITPFGILLNPEKRNFFHKKNYSSKGKLLILSATTPRINYWICSIPLSSQNLMCINKIHALLKLLPEKIIQMTILRLLDPYWLSSQFLKKEFPLTERDNLSASYLSRLVDCRLAIVTWNATVLLELLSRNFPTLILLDWKINELRSEAKPFYDSLASAGILFDSEISLSKKITEIWGNVDLWWSNANIQIARNKFCTQFANTPKNPIKNLIKIIRE